VPKNFAKKAFCLLKAFQKVFSFRKRDKITLSFEKRQTKELCAKHTDLFSAKLLKILKKLFTKSFFNWGLGAKSPDNQVYN